VSHEWVGAPSLMHQVNAFVASSHVCSCTSKCFRYL